MKSASGLKLLYRGVYSTCPSVGLTLVASVFLELDSVAMVTDLCAYIDTG